MKLNLTRVDLVDAEGWPLDWSEKTGLRGFSRNTPNRRYDVRLTVAGSQLFIGVAYSQGQAARLYDLALWKLCAKLERGLHPNFPDDFKDMEQGDVEQNCPNLNAQYAKAPLLSADHAGLSEDALRAQRLSRPLDLRDSVSFEGLSRDRDVYSIHMARIKRLRMTLGMASITLSRSRAALDLRKLPAVSDDFAKAATAADLLAIALKELDSNLESQRAFYDKERAERRAALDPRRSLPAQLLPTHL